MSFLKKNSLFLRDEIGKIKINKVEHCFIFMPYKSKISSILAKYVGGWMVGWLWPKSDPLKDVGEQSGNPEETAWAGLFLDRRSHRRQWNLYLCSSGTVSGAAHNKPLTGTDRQTPRLDRKGRREEETNTGRQSVLYFLFFSPPSCDADDGTICGCYQVAKFDRVGNLCIM